MRRAVVVLAMVAVLAGGGASAQSPSPAAGLDLTGGICYLASDAEVGAIFGRMPMMPGIGVALGGLRECAWTIYLSPMLGVSIQLGSPTDFDAQKDVFTEKVYGVGEEAYWMGGEGYGQMLVRTPAGTLTVSLISQADMRAQTTALAQLVASRLAPSPSPS